MKNIILFVFIAVLLLAYFILQSGDSITAVTPGAEGGRAADATALLAKPDKPVVLDANELQSGSAMPETGSADKRLQEKGKPLEPAIRDAVRELVNTSHEGLVEEETEKGVEMKLKGRFRTAPVATLDEDGGVTVRDYTAAPIE